MFIRSERGSGKEKDSQESVKIQFLGSRIFPNSNWIFFCLIFLLLGIIIIIIIFQWIWKKIEVRRKKSFLPWANSSSPRPHKFEPSKYQTNDNFTRFLAPKQGP